MDWMSEGQAVTMVQRSLLDHVEGGRRIEALQATQGEPGGSAPPKTKKPPIEKNGKAHKSRDVPLSTTVSPNAAVVWTIELWAWTTPLGRALDPDV